VSGYGYHWTPCRGGDSKVIVAGGGLFAGVLAVEWLAAHAWEVLAVTALCGAAAVTAVVALMRWTDRRAAAFGARLAARRAGATLTATVIPQVSQHERPAIPQVVNYNFYGADSTMAARVIRQAIPDRPGPSVTKGE